MRDGACFESWTMSAVKVSGTVEIGVYSAYSPLDWHCIVVMQREPDDFCLRCWACL